MRFDRSLCSRLPWLAASAALCSLAAPSAHAEERRIATLAPTGSPWMNILDQGAAKLAAATGGRITTKYYAGAVQGDERDVVRKMKMGHLDGAGMTVIGLSMIYPGIRVLQLPFMFHSEDEVAHVRDKMWPHFQKKFREHGFVLQSPGGAGFDYVYSNHAIASVADLKKITMWVWSDDPVLKALYQRLGVKAVPLSVPDLLGALKTGRVDACTGPPLAAVALQWYNEVTYVSAIPISYTIGGAVVRYEVWNKATDADKQSERTIGQWMAKQTNRRVRKDEQRALSAMKRAGLTLITPPPPVIARLRREAEAVWRELAGTVYSEEELALVLKHLADFRSAEASK
jgi:TRAP-type transport system periplasmic protein